MPIALLVGFLVALVAALPAYAELAGVSPDRNPRTGFPLWYQDKSTPGIQVKLCVDSPMCLGGDPRPNTNKPASLKVDAKPKKPGLQPNMPDEAFYAAARAETELFDGDNDGITGRIRWRAVLEGAFASAKPRPDRQITFTRIQITGSNIDTSEYSELTFVTPYGELTGTVNEDGTLDRLRRESDPGTPADFTPPAVETVTGYGPEFLRWDTDRPAGFLGDPLIPHTITGGDNGVNTFQVFDGTTTTTPASDPVTQFEIAGQCVEETC